MNSEKASEVNDVPKFSVYLVTFSEQFKARMLHLWFLNEKVKMGFL
uniref:Uncharacterized protein n=1 Tax=Anguilla anguilla TaxID=7936 RepID=A0A0E9UUN8_ANGAN